MSEVDNLFKRPAPDMGANQPHFVNNSVENGVHQMDLLFLPTDGKYSYALVVVDLATRKTDARPLRGKTAKEVADALKEIYDGKVLKKPMTIEVDDGSEFRSEFKKWIEQNGVNLIIKKPGRHQQQAMVEKKNQVIGVELFKLMTARELLTGKTNKEWVKDLPDVVKGINEKARKPDKIDVGDPICSGRSCELVPEGTKVRVRLDYPIDVVTHKKLHGNFRAHDIKWDPKIRTVTHQLLKPSLPPMYMVSGVNNASYTKNQLQVVDKDEKDPDPSVLRKKPSTYVMKKIIDVKVIKGKKMYKVLWKGFPNDPTWEPEGKIHPDLIQDFERD